MKALQTALAPQTNTWKHKLWTWLRGIDHGIACLPATLDYVYDDDCCLVAYPSPGKAFQLAIMTRIELLWFTGFPFRSMTWTY